MVRLACGHTVETQAHLSDGATVVAAYCPVCRGPEPISVTALVQLSSHGWFRTLRRLRALRAPGLGTGRGARGSG